MVEGLTATAPYQGSGGCGREVTSTQREIEDLRWRPRSDACGVAPSPCRNVASSLCEFVAVNLRTRIDSQTQEILVTLAERPHPFPSRTRKLSSPAPKILRGQPFGKIGRRQDFCVNGPKSQVARIGRAAEAAVEREGAAPVECQRWQFRQ